MRVVMPLLRLRFLAAGCTGAALVLGAAAVRPAAAQDSEAERLFIEGKDLYLKGQDEEALAKFEEVLRLKPDHRVAHALREAAGSEFFIELLMKRDGGEKSRKLQAFARLLLAKAEETLEIDDVEEAEITEAMGLLDKKYDIRWPAIEKLSYRIGQQAAPALVKALGDSRNDDLRNGAVQACIKMGQQIVPALLEAIESDNQLVRQNCCAILGAIGDDRAMAELKRVSENPNEPPEVRGYADRALRALTGKTPAELQPAKYYYFQKAILYYRDHPAIIRERDKRWFVWKWQDGDLTHERVPRWLYHLRLAEEACYDGVRLDYTYERIWPVMALVNLSQFLEVQAHLARSPEDQKESLNALLATNRGGHVLGFPAGQRVLFQALDQALKDQEPELAEACIDVLARICDGRDLVGAAAPAASADGETPATAAPTALVGQPLIDALNYHDKRSAKRVRYAAGSALVTIADRNPALKAPGRSYDWAERVVEVLAEAAGESGTRTVLVIDSDSQTRRAVAQELVSLGYFVTEAADVHSGLRNAKAFPSQDMIVMDAGLAHQETFAVQSPRNVKHRQTLIDSLRDDWRTAEIPIVIAADEGALERARTLFEKDAKGFIARRVPPNREELKAEMARVMDAHPSEMKGAADVMSARASQSLGQIDPHHTIFPVGKSVPALGGVLEARPDAVREPALGALGRIGDAQSLAAITRLIQNTADNAPAIRSAAARAIGEVLIRSKASLPTDTFDALLAGVNDPAPEVQLAAGEALGKVKLSDEQRYRVFEARRMHYKPPAAPAAPEGAPEAPPEAPPEGAGENG